MLVEDFAYDLPEELIAQEALEDRAGSRMLHLRRSPPALADREFRDLPGLLKPGDLLVFNNTRVFPARLYGIKIDPRAQFAPPEASASREGLKTKVEVLLIRSHSEAPGEWECLVRPGRKIGVGDLLCFGDEPEGDGEKLAARVIARGRFGERRIRFETCERMFEVLERIGHVPLPPYIRRPDRGEDRVRYQTVYAKERGSVAAPTAGLHFTEAILDEIGRKGAETAEITLHVGLGTFQPVREPRVEDHRLHSEAYSIGEEAADRINRALTEGRRVIAIGTTTVRALEHAARSLTRPGVVPGRGEADLFLYPGYRFRVTGAMLTNFHLPESTLLMLVCAFGGTPAVLAAYRHAVERRFRFYSYGDCMFLE